MGVGGSDGWGFGRDINRHISAGVGSACVILYLILMVDMILIIFMDPSVVQMMENMIFNLLYESIQ